MSDISMNDWTNKIISLCLLLACECGFPPAAVDKHAEMGAGVGSAPLAGDISGGAVKESWGCSNISLWPDLRVLRVQDLNPPQTLVLSSQQFSKDRFLSHTDTDRQSADTKTNLLQYEAGSP